MRRAWSSASGAGAEVMEATGSVRRPLAASDNLRPEAAWGLTAPVYERIAPPGSL